MTEEQSLERSRLREEVWDWLYEHGDLHEHIMKTVMPNVDHVMKYMEINDPAAYERVRDEMICRLLVEAYNKFVIELITGK